MSDFKQMSLAEARQQSASRFWWEGIKEALPYLPWILLALGFLAWLLFMPVPALFGLHNAAFHKLIENLPFILIALSILGAGHLALLNKRWIKFSVFLIVPLIIFGWY